MNTQSRRFFYQLAAALPMALAISFGLSLWQTGGVLLSGSSDNSRFYFLDSRFFTASGFIPVAQAAGCNTAVNPADPTGANGAIYYNSCAGLFRMFSGATDAVPAGGTWKDLNFVNYWAQGSGQDIYNVAMGGGNVYVGKGLLAGATTVGTTSNNANKLLAGPPIQNVIYGLALSSSDPGTNLLLLQSASGTSGASYTDRFAVRVDGTVQVGVGGKLVLGSKANPDPTGSNGALYYNTSTNKFRCYQGGSWQDCIASGASSTYWNYKTPGDATSNLVNQNSYNNQSGYPGVVEVNDTLYVLNTLYVKNVPRAGGPWTSDIQTASPPPPTPTDLGCQDGSGNATANCALNELFITPSGGVKVAMGLGGMLMVSTAPNQWVKLFSVPAAPHTFQSLWVKDSATIYAIDKEDVDGHGLVRFSGGAWTDTCAVGCSNTNALTFAYSHVWSYAGQNMVYFTSSNKYIHYYDGGWGTITLSLGTLTDIPALISGDSTNRIFVASNFATVGVVVKHLAQVGLVPPATSNANKISDISISAVAALDPTVLAVDYNGSCGVHCVVLLGRYDTNQPGTKTSIMIGDGNTTWNTYVPVAAGGNGLKAANDNAPQPDYNDGNTAWNSAWVGKNGSQIILSGTRGTCPGASCVNIVLYSADAGITWVRSSPDNDGSPCTEVACPAYAVSGTTTSFYAAQFYNRIFSKTVSIGGASGGFLQVAGDAQVDTNIWGGTAGVAGSAPSQNIKITPPLNGDKYCPSGEYIVGLNFASGGISGIYCQRL